MTTHYSFGSAGTARNRANQHTAATERHTMTSAADIDTRIQAADARPHAPEALVERMARAMWAADCGLHLDEISGDTPEPYVRLAAAALRVVTERADGGAK